MKTMTVLLAAAAAMVIIGWFRSCSPRTGADSDTQARDPLSLGRELAKWKRKQRDRHTLTQLRLDRARLHAAMDILAEQDEDQDWALDHASFAEQQILTLQEDFRGHRMTLPGKNGVFRLEWLCRQLVRAQGGSVTPESAAEYLTEFQKACPLTLKELALFSICLKVRLLHEAVEAMSLCAQHGRSAFRGREDAMNGEEPSEDVFAPGGVLDTVYADSRYKTLAQQEDSAQSLEVFAHRLRVLGYDVRDLASLSRSARLSVRDRGCACMQSLRAWEKADEREWMACVSLVEDCLRQDHIYREMDEESRAVYRSAVTDWAGRCRVSERYAAQTALDCARKHPGEEKNGHVGFYLLREGREELSRALGKPRHFDTEEAVWLRVQLFWWLLSAAWVLTAFAFGGIHWLIALWLPARQVSWEILRRWRAPVWRNFIPRLQLRNHLPEGRRMLLTLPALVSEPEQVDALFRRLEAIYTGNAMEGLYCVLLADLPESSTREQPQDPEVLRRGERKARELCERYGQERFVFLLRGRIYAKTQRAYLGRERKRGALEALNRLTQYNEVGDFMDLSECPQAIRGVDWIACVDADTKVLPGSLCSLAGALAHPLNQPLVENGRVIQGYGMIMPRIENEFVSPSHKFAYAAGGEGGLDSYSFAAGEFHQDHLGQTLFTGKGAYWVKTALDTANAWIMPERVLSHDMLEGCFLRTGLVSDTVMLDGFPGSLRSYLRRLHRWVRGDWQLLPYLFPLIRDAKGQRRKNPLSLIHRTWILQNLLRSLTPAALCLLPLWGVYTDHPWWGLILTALYFFAPVVLHTVEDIHRSPAGEFDLSREKQPAAQALFSFLTLPLTAYTQLNAAITALIRLISGRQLLNWVPAAQTDRLRSGFLRKYLFYTPQAVFSLLLALLGWMRSWPEGVTAAFFWLGGIGYCLWLSREKEKKGYRCSERDKETLIRWAKDTWSYFTEIYREEDHFLPPDNVQADPVHRVAHRTSPTDIGLAMTAQVCAALLGFQSREEARNHIRATTDTLTRMERWHGHWFNWYDTRSLAVLEPRYVSAVDSGNLAACLYLCSAVFRDDDGQLADEWYRLAQEMDFAALYDEKRDLFTIGFNPESGQFSGDYDLLASESRLTSFLAVASGQVPLRHWYRLGRPVGRVNGGRMLLSWGGTFFEYLMPSLFLREPEGSLLGDALALSLQAQKRYAANHHLPVGVSESGFAAFDRDMNYQYRAFGIPECAMRGSDLRSLVCAPYTCAMALALDRASMLDNLRGMEEMGAYESWGFCEAIDFDPARLREGEKLRVVRSAMSHHQGMILMALTREVCGDALREKFYELPMVSGASMLLAERPARGACVRRTSSFRKKHDYSQPQAFPVQMLDGAAHSVPACTLLTGRDFYALACEDGIHALVYRNLCMSRLRRREREAQGLLIYTRLRNGKWIRMGQDARGCLEEHRARYEQDLCDLHQEAAFWADAQRSLLLGKITWENRGSTDLYADCTICLEPSLAAYERDLAHPGYQGLFMQCDTLPDGLIVLRRPDKEGEKPLSMALCCPGEKEFSWTFSRAEAQGRGCSWSSPKLTEISELPNERGAQTDPVLCLRISRLIRAGEKEEIPVLCAFGQEEAQTRQICRAADRPEDYGRSLDLAWHQQQSIFRGCEMTPRHLDLVQKMLPYVMLEYPIQSCRAKMLISASFRQEDFWVWGLPENRPIVTLVVHRMQDGEALHHLCLCQRYLREKGAGFLLVVLYRDGGDYPQSLAHLLEQQIHPFVAGDYSGDVVLVREEPRTEAQISMLLSCSRIVLYADRLLTNQLIPHVPDLPISGGLPSEFPGIQENLEDFNGWGGFDPQGRYYRISSLVGRTLQPWAQVVSNGISGAVVTSDFGGFLFQGNSQRQPLTPFFCDAVRDPVFMELQLRDERGVCYRLSEPGGAILFPGGIRWLYKRDGIQATLDLFAPTKGEMLVFLLKLRCDRDAGFQLCFAPMLRLRPLTEPGELRWRALDAGILAENSPTNCGTVFFAMPGCTVLSGDWKIGQPTLCLPVRLEAGETRLYAAALGRRETREEAEAALTSLPDARTLARLADRTQTDWDMRLGAVRVRTADPRFDRMVNTFLPYQLWACRYLARAGYYQNGGAFGFRDQLQDAIALMWYDPSLTRRHILLCASHQFEQGDVQHWWHEPALGVRTRIRDDRLFLPWAVLRYVEFTGDEKIWKQEVSYLAGSVLGEQETDRYEAAQTSDLSESLLQHCIRAVESSFETGEHGLPLMGSGDWNDAMNRVGHKGKGESLFVAFLMIDLLKRMIPILEREGENARGDRWRQHLQGLLDAVEKHGWDGAWYRRAYTDEGKALGSQDNDVCQIDALTQAWAVFALGSTSRTRQAVISALSRLWNRKRHIFLLLDPPFTRMGEYGYISGYQAGIRENGGQYTHAAAWMVLALCRIGMKKEAYELFTDLLPSTHSDSVEKAMDYAGEPYAAAADVYSAPGLTGRAGWTWYTGSAGWLLRAALEGILGIDMKGGKAEFCDEIPVELGEAEIRLKGKRIERAPQTE